MASLHKDPREKSPFWYCSFYLPDGRRAFKSTKHLNRAKANTICLEWERASKKAVDGELTQTQAKKMLGDLGEKLIEDAKKPRDVRNSRRAEDQAGKVLSQILILAGAEGLKSQSIRDFLMEWIESKTATNAGTTAIRYRGVVESFLAFIGKRKAKVKIASLTPQDISGFRDIEVRQGKSKTTANLALKILRSALNDARRQGLILTNPAEAVKIFTADKEARDVFTNDQVRDLFLAAPLEWQTAILLAYYTGARLSDCSSMAWENISLEKKELRFFPKKTSHGLQRKPDWKKHVNGQLEIPLPAELEAHLLSLAGTDDPEAQLCPTLAKKSTGGNHGLSGEFTRIMGKAGIHAEEGVEKSGKGRRFKTLGFHSLRHTFVSELANRDVAADVRQKISGHNDEEMPPVRSVSLRPRYAVRGTRLINLESLLAFIEATADAQCEKEAPAQDGGKRK